MKPGQDEEVLPLHQTLYFFFFCWGAFGFL